MQGSQGILPVCDRKLNDAPLSNFLKRQQPTWRKEVRERSGKRGPVKLTRNAPVPNIVQIKLTSTPQSNFLYSFFLLAHSKLIIGLMSYIK